jgi:hypothetical protein
MNAHVNGPACTPGRTDGERRGPAPLGRAAGAAPASGRTAFLLDKDLSRCLAEVDREEWEWALSSCGGDVADAAHQCGLDDVPPGAKALWGRSAEQARDTYRRWQKRRARR